MIEIEVRARIKDIDEIKKILNKMGVKFVKTEKQIDRVFGHPMFIDSENMIIEGGLIARIRETNDKKLLEFKEISRQTGGMEISVELDDINIGLDFLKKLNFREDFKISKSRESYSFNDFTICLDNVDQLGRFIEIEKMITSSEDKEKVKKECIDLLRTLVPNSEIEDRRYGDLMQEIINRKERDSNL